MARITFENKVPRRTLDVPDINQVTAADLNQIKTSVNALYDLLDLAYVPKFVSITSADFSGSSYTNTQLIDKTAMVDFNIFINNGSGTLLKVNDGYTFNASIGRLTMDADNYIIQINVKLT